MFGFRRRRRERLRARPFPPDWLAIIERNVPAYHRLPPEDQAELRAHIQVFLAEKRFEGLAGLEMADEIRVTIASQACMLLLHRETDYYPTLRTIFVYPHAYVAQSKRIGPGGVVTEGEDVRLGESWHRGSIVFSWRDVLQGGANDHDGRNVVYHEFAHQLDGESGSEEGAPALPSPSMYGPWARVLSREYQQLLDDLEHHRRTLIDQYGATNPAEFFAVVTELFFEQPAALRQRHRALYDQLAAFYMQDPASRQPPHPEPGTYPGAPSLHTDPS